MTEAAGTIVCPKGHPSLEPDYCSECGAKIEGAAATPAGGTLSGTTAQLCPDCGTPREQTGSAFCEVCGFNFATGAHGELSPAFAAVPQSPELDGAVPETAPPTSTATRWSVLVTVDPSLRRPESPEPPPGLQPITVDLDRSTSLIGRTNEARAIFPEVDLVFDEAVSRRHALLERSDTGTLSLRDIGSANGTRLNGRELAPMTDTPLKAGDEITLGHWTRVTVQGNG